MSRETHVIGGRYNWVRIEEVFYIDVCDKDYIKYKQNKDAET